MMHATQPAALLAGLLALCVTGGPGFADGDRWVDLHLSGDGHVQTVSDEIAGRETAVYRLTAEAGRILSLRLSASTNAVHVDLYGPGSGPGDAVMASTDTAPQMNGMEVRLPASGVYTVGITLHPSAAEAGDTVSFRLDASLAVRSLADGELVRTAPDFFEVRTAGSPLLMRASPSTSAARIGRLANGAMVQNLGCLSDRGRRWCRVATLEGPLLEGWVAGAYLSDGPSAPPPPDAIRSGAPSPLELLQNGRVEDAAHVRLACRTL